MKTLNKFFSSIAVKAQLALITLSIVGISFAYINLVDVNESAYNPELVSLIKSHIYWQIAIAIMFNLILGILIRNAITKPIHEINNVMNTISEGNLDIDIPYCNYRNEIGSLANQVKTFKIKSAQLIESEKLMSDVKAKSEEEKRKQLSETLAHLFDSKVVSIVNKFGEISDSLLSTSSNLESSTNTSGEYVAGLMNVAEHANNNVETVAQAAEKLTSSIAEINNQTSKSANISQDATVMLFC